MTIDLERLAESASQWASAKTAKLGRNSVSRFHKLAQAMVDGHIYNASSKKLEDREISIFGMCTGVFVVEHDWLAVLGDEARIDNDEFSNPYPLCAYEFVVNELPCIVVVAQGREMPLVALPFVLIDGNWVVFSDEDARSSEPLSIVWQEVLAVGAMLDAGVAASDVVEAPAKLNAKRARSGKAPLVDYRVVRLSKRLSGASKGACDTKKRLHFRRGHWRHLHDRKTWIKWMLVGNPDLGFIDHHYKL